MSSNDNGNKNGNHLDKLFETVLGKNEESKPEETKPDFVRGIQKDLPRDYLEEVNFWLSQIKVETISPLEKARYLLRNILEDPHYLIALKCRAILGQLPSQVENMMWRYVYGKPATTIDINVTREQRKEELKRLPREELVSRLKRIAEKAEQAEKLKKPDLVN